MGDKPRGLFPPLSNRDVMLVWTGGVAGAMFTAAYEHAHELYWAPNVAPPTFAGMVLFLEGIVAFVVASIIILLAVAAGLRILLSAYRSIERLLERRSVSRPT